MHHFPKIRTAALTPALLSLLLTALAPTGAARGAEPRIALSAHAAQAPALRGARLVGHLTPTATLRLALTLPPRSQGALDELVRRQYTPGDSLSGHFMTSDEFTARFGPTQADYNAVVAWAKSQGLTVTHMHGSRMLLGVAGTVAQVEAAFGIRMNQYRVADGRMVFANSAAPTVPRSVGLRLAGIAGLSSLARMHPQLRRMAAHPMGVQSAEAARAGASQTPASQADAIGSGPAGGLSPNDIKYAYGLSTVAPLYGAAAGVGTGTLNGKGQSIGLFELDGFASSDIDSYISTFGLPSVPGATSASTVQTVLIDGFNGVVVDAVNGQPEVTLDIDMALALAPSATIYSYEGKESALAITDTSVVLDIFQRMADDTATGSASPKLQVISCSWGVPEQDEDPAIRSSENTIFQKMAAQGQSIFCSSGDFGAYDNYNPLTPLISPTLSVDNPASQPYITGVGGTTLSYTKPSTSAAGAAVPGSYVSETVWKTGTLNNLTGPEGGGGGSSVIWGKPSYQVGLGASPSSRDVPDVALDADPTTGYDIYVKGVAQTVGGTSAGAPLWAAFAALVNQQRGVNGLTTTLGFANPTLYSLGRSTSYTSLFHDVTLGDNLYYQAAVGYDDATGFGSFIGAPLIAALSTNADQGVGTATLTGTVTVSGSGTPVAGATVSATSVATGLVKATAITDATGTYTLTVPGSLSLLVSVDTSTIIGATTNYAAPTPVNLTLTAGTTTTQNFTLAAAHTFAAGLQMISAPYDFTGLGDFATLFGLSLPLANPNPRLIQWDPSVLAYVFYPTTPADTLRPGQGYWVKFPTAAYLHRLGAPVSTTQAYRIPLTQGWNQIGDPFFASVALSGLTADTAAGTGAVALSAATSPVQPTVYQYVPGTGAYATLDPAAGTLDPYNGYWIYARQAAVLTVPAPASTAPPPPAAPGG